MNNKQLNLFLSNYKNNIYDVFVDGEGEQIESIQFIQESRKDRDHIGEYILIKLGE